MFKLFFGGMLFIVSVGLAFNEPHGLSTFWISGSIGLISIAFGLDELCNSRKK